MEIISTKNVHTALPVGLFLLDKYGVKSSSRNGEVKVYPTPVTTIFQNPTQRVMFHAGRDCNPFFHLMESLWMMAGRNDVEFVAQYVKRMKDFSDDGETFNGAYGFRWRQSFGYDQVDLAINMLKETPDTRRVVIGMWDPTNDLGSDSKDIPCNTAIYLSIGVNGKLNMTVTNRSNDMIWGAYGANAVHMSFLQEVVAGAVGVEVGTYYQISNNYHAYTDVLNKTLEKVAVTNNSNPYADGVVEAFPVINSPIDVWMNDLKMFMGEGVGAIGLKDRFFRRVVVPMARAHFAYKEYGDVDKAIIELKECKASDWYKASVEWLERRRKD